MGAKDSKPQVISYEEAAKRVNNVELKRLKDTFGKYSTPNGLLQQSIFLSEIIGDTVPSNLADLIYTAWGGTAKGITFKDLLSGLVLLTRGTQDEKCRFIFSLYAKDINSVVTKDNVVNYTTKYSDGWNLENISSLFDEAEAVNYSKFREWLITNPCSTSLTQWLLSDPCPITLSNDLETPTFYQTLSGVTHLDEQEIIDLEKKYWQLKNLSSNGKFDIELFLSFASAPISSNSDEDVSKFSIARGLFSAFDENCDGHLDFKEIVCGISAACRGPLVERIKFCFKIFDVDRDGVFSYSEVTQLIESLKRLAVEQFPENSSDADSLEITDLIANEMESVDLESFLMWAVKRNALEHLLDMLHQLCHVVLGLRPASRTEEGKLIQNWLRREVKRGYRIGEFWYLISCIWWKQWSDYVAPNQDDSSKHPPSNAPLRNNPSDSGSDVGTVVRPTAIDNTCLVATSTVKATVLTGEGGRLRRELEKGKDYEVVPEAIWKALSAWYGGSPALPRQAVQFTESGPVELELYPLLLRLLRHSSTTNDNGPAWNGQSWNSIVGGYGAAALAGGYGYFPSATQQTPRRYLAYVAAFSQLATVSQTYEYLCGRLRLKFDDVRLWLMKDDHCLVLLEDENATLASLSCRDNDQLLIEVRNKDLTWPEEMVSLSGQSGDKYRQALPSEKGATGLNNLGNTCFMNASLQCVSNTQALTQYFTSSMHLLELNRDNPLGMKGNIAKDYGDLIRDIWKGKSRTIAPLRLRWTIGKYAPRFNGYQQHDAQELLAFLLDGLHEDLNRVHDKPYVELSDSEGRPDVVVAQEAWENHLLRNRSIVVELFHGQLKSKVTCGVCQRESVRFDPFNYLSLPLPLESYVHVEVVVLRLDGSVPVKYGLRLPMDATYLLLKERLASLCQISPDHLLFAEVSGAMIKTFPGLNNKVRPTSGLALFAYQVLSSTEVIQFLPVNGGNIGAPDSGAKEANRNNNKIGHHSNNQIPKVIDKGGDTNATTTSSEVRRPVGICMNVMSTVFCRKNGTSPGQESLPQRSTNAIQQPVTNGGTNDERNGDRSSLASTSSGSGGLGSPVSLTSNNSSTQELNGSLGMGASFLVVYHRKMIRQDLYFVSPHKTRPSLFGLPLLVPLAWRTDVVSSSGDERNRMLVLQTTSQDLYRCVWTLVSRLVSPSPPTDSGTLPNHAHDCDDSLGYEFPFTLKVVQANGIHCGICPWTKFCKGCPLAPTPDPLPNGSETNSSYIEGVLNYCIAVDWEPTALHLRYQTSLEKVFDEDPSVAKALHQQTEPVSLEQCLQAFTREEQLSGDEKYYCPKCATHQPATKKLQIWRLPPILIVHLKRFQFVNHRWIKSHKAVQFPHNNLDFTEFLAAIPSETLVRHRQMASSSMPPNGVAESSKDESNDISPKHSISSSVPYSNGHPPNIREVITGNESTRKRLESTSLITHPVHDEDLIDFHQHRLLPGYNKLDITYSLYAAVCHSGIMGGGHYISYAKNPNGKWFYYNDSTCKESSANQIEGQTAYMLFFERDGIDMKAYLPKLREPSTSSAESANSESTSGKVAVAVSGLEEEEGKKCCIM